MRLSQLDEQRRRSNPGGMKRLWAFAAKILSSLAAFALLIHASAREIHAQAPFEQWTRASTTTSNQISAISHGLSGFVATTSASRPQTLYSSEGVNWQVTSNFYMTKLGPIVAGDEKYLLIVGSILSSTNGVTWKINSSNPVPFPTKGLFGKGVYVILSSGAMRVSVDGAVWSTPVLTSPNGAASFVPNFSKNWITFDDNIFIGFLNRRYYYTSEDGFRWSGLSLLPFELPDYSVANTLSGKNGRFVAVTTNGIVSFTLKPDSVTVIRTNTMNTVALGSGWFVAAGAKGTVLVSSNGTDWFGTFPGQTNNWTAAGFGNGRFVLGDDKGNIYYSGSFPVPKTNARPSFSPTDGSFSVLEGETLRFNVTATDPENQSIRYSLRGDRPDTAQIDSASGEFVYRPGEREGGLTNLITVMATDSGDPPTTGYLQFKVVVVESNLPPFIIRPADRIVTGRYELQLDYGDPDYPYFGPIITNTVVPAGGSIDQYGSLSYEGPTNTIQTHHWSVTVIDAKDRSLTNSASFQVHLMPYEINSLLPRWTLRSPKPLGLTGGKFVEANGMLFLIKDLYTASETSDGVHWTQQGFWGGLSDLVYGNGTYVGLTGDESLRAGSDLEILAKPVHPTGPPLPMGIAYGAGHFVGVYPEGGISVSDDGTNWVWRSSLRNLQDVAFGNGLFVSVGFPGIVISTNAIDWTVISPPVFNPQNVLFSEGEFLIPTQGQVLVSTNGVSWTAWNFPDGADIWNFSKSGGVYFLITDDRSLYYSRNLPDWERSSVPPGLVIEDVAFFEGQFYLAGYDMPLFHSADPGGPWVTDTIGTAAEIQNCVYGKGRFIATTYNQSELMTSTNGIVWKTFTPQTNWIFSSIVFAKDRFVAGIRTTDFKFSAVSSDGIDWQPSSDVQTNRFFSALGFGDDLFVAVRNEYYFLNFRNSVISTSPDGLTWTDRLQTPTNLFLSTIAYGNHRFVVSGAKGSLFRMMAPIGSAPFR
jgi:hypothetical protein